MAERWIESFWRDLSTSRAERFNFTLRTQMKRFARLTNVHSNKIQNQMYAFAIQSVFYNFVGIHQTLHITPAMECGISDRVWSLEEVVGLLEVEAK